jgi:hypothetical protein
MTFEDIDAANETIQRFRWIDNSKFKIVNPEGIEKIVDY